MFRKIGIVGGIGWRSTAEYYAALEERAAQWPSGGRNGNDPPLEISIESLDLSVARALLCDGERDGRWEGFDNYHRAALVRLERSEAELAIFACNIPYERILSIARGTRIRIVDLFDALGAQAEQRGARRLLILGPPATMSSSRLHALLGARNIDPVVPPPPFAGRLEQLISDLQRDPVIDAWNRLAMIVEGSLETIGERDLVSLHCPELSLLLPSCRRLPVCHWQGMHFLNASMNHVEAALRAAHCRCDNHEPGTDINAPPMKLARALH